MAAQFSPEVMAQSLQSLMTSRTISGSLAQLEENSQRRFAPFMIALLQSATRITSVQKLLPGWKADRKLQLTMAVVTSLMEVAVSCQKHHPQIDKSTVERLIVTFITHIHFWEDLYRAGEEIGEGYALEGAEQVLSMAQQSELEDNTRNMVSDAYMSYCLTLEKKFMRTKSREDLGAAQRAVRCAGQHALSSESTMTCKVLLANQLWVGWRSGSQNEATFQEAIETSWEVVQGDIWASLQTGELLDRYATMHNYLLEASDLCATWFRNQEVFSDLDAAIKTASMAYQGLLPGTPQDVREKTTRLFGDISRHRYNWTGSFTDLCQTVAAARTSLTNFPSEPGQIDWSWPRYGSRLADLSSYFDREDLGNDALAYLHRWAKFHESKPGVPLSRQSQDASICFQRISDVFRKIWQRRRISGKVSSLLDLSIQFAETAVKVLPERDTLSSECFDNQALAYYRRHSSPQQKPSDLDNALTAAMKAASCHPLNYRDMSRAPMAAERMTVVSIGIAGDLMGARYLRDGQLSDLDASIHAVELLLKLLPMMHPQRAHALQSRRDLLELRYRRCLGKDARVREQYLLERWLYMVHGPQSLSCQYLRDFDLDVIRDLARLDRLRSRRPGPLVVGRPQMTVSMLGNDLIYPDFSPVTFARGSYATDLRLSIDKPGICVYGSARPSLDDGISDLKVLLQHESVDESDGEIMTDLERISSGKRSKPEQVTYLLSIGERLFQSRRWKAVQVTWRLCFGALDALDLHSMRSREYQAAFRRLGGFAVQVASSMLMQNAEVWSVIMVLERGREVLNSLGFLSTRSQRVKYAFNLERQADEIIADMKNSGPERNIEYRRSQFRHLPAFERSSRELFKSIEELAGCGRDIEPIGKEQIIQQSRGGPIVMLVATETGAHAILITPIKTHAIALKKFRYEDAVEKSRAARLALSQCERTSSLLGAANRELRQFLKWLWDSTVHPVVAALGLVPKESVVELPRIQWVCCGIFSRLPVHAAGNFTKPGKLHLAQYAVSSYLSSVRYTIMAKRKDPYLAPTQSQILVVAMPHTDGDDKARYGDLDTEAEARAIKANLPKQFGTTFLTNTDMGGVQSLLGNSRIAHFSCHGVVDTGDPLQSRLVIRFDKQSPLSVSAIRNLSSSYARLAFLSACHSSDFEDMSTADEVVHVAKAFQLAGFPSVVGTLWQAFDQDLPLVSGEFYAYLARRMDEDGKSLDGDLIARALHSAIAKLRNRTLLHVRIGRAGFTMVIERYS